MEKKANRSALVLAGGIIWGFLLIWADAGIAQSPGEIHTNTATDKLEKPEDLGEVDELEGFDGENEDPFAQIDLNLPDTHGVPIEDKSYKIGGFVKLESEYGFNKKGENLSMLKGLFFVEAEKKVNDRIKLKASGQAFYDLSYDIEARDENEGFNQDDSKNEVELRDLYLDGQLTDRVSLRLGRQIIAWGVSDYARITDVTNPRDLTRPGLIDLEDARLPVAALRLSSFYDAWSFDLVSIHEHPGSKISGMGGDFDYFAGVRSSSVSIKNKQAPDFGEEISIALNTTYSFNGGDISLVVADTFDDRPVLGYDKIENGVMEFTPEYDRFTTYGVASSLARGGALFKAEAALRQDRQIMRTDLIPQITEGLPPFSIRTTSGKNQVVALWGVEYTGFSDLRLSFEGQVVHTLAHGPHLGVKKNEYTAYFQATRDLFNETMELDLFWVYTAPGQGNILRLSAAYDIFDGLSVQGGVAFYTAGRDSSAIHPYKDQDRVFMRLKYSF